MATPSSLHQAAWAHVLSVSTAPLPIGHPRPPVSPSAHLQPPVYAPCYPDHCAQQTLQPSFWRLGDSAVTLHLACPSQVSIPRPLPCSHPRLFLLREAAGLSYCTYHTHILLCVFAVSGPVSRRPHLPGNPPSLFSSSLRISSPSPATRI